MIGFAFMFGFDRGGFVGTAVSSPTWPAPTGMGWLYAFLLFRSPSPGCRHHLAGAVAERIKFSALHSDGVHNRTLPGGRSLDLGRG